MARKKIILGWDALFKPYSPPPLNPAETVESTIENLNELLAVHNTSAEELLKVKERLRTLSEKEGVSGSNYVVGHLRYIDWYIHARQSGKLQKGGSR